MITVRANNNHAEVWIENDILNFQYKALENLNLSIAKECVKLRLSIQKHWSFPVLCNLREVIQADKLAMDYLAKEGSLQTTAVALLVNYPHSTFTAGFYVNTSLPPVPTQIFEDVNAAKRFLRNYPKKTELDVF